MNTAKRLDRCLARAACLPRGLHVVLALISLFFIVKMIL